MLSVCTASARGVFKKRGSRELGLQGVPVPIRPMMVYGIEGFISTDYAFVLLLLEVCRIRSMLCVSLGATSMVHQGSKSEEPFFLFCGLAKPTLKNRKGRLSTCIIPARAEYTAHDRPHRRKAHESNGSLSTRSIPARAEYRAHGYPDDAALRIANLRSRGPRSCLFNPPSSPTHPASICQPFPASLRHRLSSIAPVPPLSPSCSTEGGRPPNRTPLLIELPHRRASSTFLTDAMFAEHGVTMYQAPVVLPQEAPPLPPEHNHGTLSISEQGRRAKRRYRSLKQQRKVVFQGRSNVQNGEQTVGGDDPLPAAEEVGIAEDEVAGHAEDEVVGLAEDVQAGLAEDVQAGLAEDVQAGLAEDVQAGLAEDVQAGHAEDVQAGLAEDVQAGLAEDVQAGLPEDEDEVLPLFSDESFEDHASQRIAARIGTQLGNSRANAFQKPVA